MAFATIKSPRAILFAYMATCALTAGLGAYLYGSSRGGPLFDPSDHGSRFIGGIVDHLDLVSRRRQQRSSADRLK